jgi:putative PIN family toxin of toxin-antitoxin system
MAVQVVVDTNVLVAAARSSAGASFELLRLFSMGDARWQWNISTALLLEYEAVLKREQHRQGRPMAVVDRFLDDLASKANRHAIFYLIRPILNDPDDELILELALTSASSYIVTHNRDDFRDAGRFGLGVITPGGFLRIL